MYVCFSNRVYMCCRRSHQTTDPVHPQPQLRGGLDPVTRRRPPRYLARVALPRIARPTTRTLWLSILNLTPHTYITRSPFVHKSSMLHDFSLETITAIQYMPYVCMEVYTWKLKLLSIEYWLFIRRGIMELQCSLCLDWYKISRLETDDKIHSLK